MVSFPGSIAFDEFGKPFIILRDQEQQKRLTGNDAIKVSFLNRHFYIDNESCDQTNRPTKSWKFFFFFSKKFYKKFDDFV